jgi:hypothetical protein
MEKQAEKQAKAWMASWCWTQKHLPQPWNFYACFRQVIELPPGMKAEFIDPLTRARVLHTGINEFQT